MTLSAITEYHADIMQCRDIFLPIAIVKVNRQKPAGFITEQRVNSGDQGPQQMIFNDTFIERCIRLIDACRTGHLQLAAHSPLPSFRQTGEYPELPFFLLSHLLASTSSHPLKRNMNNLIFQRFLNGKRCFRRMLLSQRVE